MRVLAGLFLTLALCGQQRAFDVATLKKAPPGQPARQRVADGAQLHYPGTSLLNLVREAYRLKSREQVDGPAWASSQLYEIHATLPSDVPPGSIPEMLQALLAARLKLAVHHELRPMQRNIVLVAKKGPRFLPAAAADEPLEAKLDVPVVHITGSGSIEQLIDELNHGLGGITPWEDRTGLNGRFKLDLNFALDWPPDSPFADRADLVGLPKLPQALEAQLGLHVEVRKLPTDIVVIDHVERTPVEDDKL